VTLAPGTSQQLSLSLKANKSLDDSMIIFVAKTLASVATVTPVSINHLKAGQSVVVSLNVQLPVLAAAGTLTGFVQLYESSGGKPDDPIGAKLPVSVTALCPCAPPDPGPGGALTLLGVDSNNNGVRDDIERYILATYPSPAMRNALFTHARLFNSALQTGGSKTNALPVHVSLIKSTECVYSIDSTGANTVLRQLVAQFYNTSARYSEYFRFGDLLGGTQVAMDPPSAFAAACTAP